MPTISIVGQGRVGAALMRRCVDRGLTVVAVGRMSYDAWLTQPATDVVVLAVREEHLASITADARAHQHCEGSLVVHVSGLLGPEVLRELSSRVAAAHPFQTFGVDDPAVLDGIAWGVDCDDPDWLVLEQFLAAIGGRPVRLPRLTKEMRLQYHASAVAANNVVYAAYSLARELARSVQIDPSAFLVPIIEQTTRNAVQAITTDQPFAITGPIARADIGAVVEQLQALPEHLRPMYQHLGLALIDALADVLTEEGRRELRKALTVV